MHNLAVHPSVDINCLSVNLCVCLCVCESICEL